MGSTMKPSIFTEKVATGLRNWHRSTRKHIRDSRRGGGSVTPTSSRHTTPSRHAYLMHLRQSSVDGLRMSPRRNSFDMEPEDAELPSPMTDLEEGQDEPSSSTRITGNDREPELTDIVIMPINEPERGQHEAGIRSKNPDPETLPPTTLPHDGEGTITSSDQKNIQGGEDGECQEPALLPKAKSTCVQHEVDVESVESPSAGKVVHGDEGEDYQEEVELS